VQLVPFAPFGLLLVVLVHATNVAKAATAAPPKYQKFFIVFASLFAPRHPENAGRVCRRSTCGISE
jgi:hypothetical protein